MTPLQTMRPAACPERAATSSPKPRLLRSALPVAPDAETILPIPISMAPGQRLILYASQTNMDPAFSPSPLPFRPAAAMA